MKLEYNVHHAINFRSHRDGLVNDLFTPMKNRQFHLGSKFCQYIISEFPVNKYPLYSKHWSKARGYYPAPIMNLELKH